MTKFILHKAETRGHAHHGWLNTYHSFSFASYFDPERIHFGALRVLNDDTVAAGMGFGTHPHNNMEIITIPLAGDLEHKDSMGHTQVIKHGDIQVMSAGTGITHSEYNKNKDKEVQLLQIWIIPREKNVTPRYDQLTLNSADRHNTFQEIVSPHATNKSVWIHQDAWFHLGKLDKGFSITHPLKNKKNGIYIFVIEGEATINQHALHKRDGLGVEGVERLDVTATDNTELLLMEVPMITL